ncbi:MAG: FIST C-terminal domain-containing protein [Rhizobiales bacterium]|nr:FIST C-terminal domain-containing protein [Hyphomicrobiales bacterium]
MVVVKSFAASSRSTSGALSELQTAIDSTAITPNLVCAFYDCDHDDSAILDFLRGNFADAAILGGTSCAGIMTETGLGGAGSIGLLLIEDSEGDYGTASVRLEGNAADCAERALHAALDNAGCSGELPELIWIYQTPGQEESVIEGLRRVVGDRCPIIGGSSADNEVAGKWRQISQDGVMQDGLVVGVLFSSGGIGFMFQGGYEPSGESGIVTRVVYDSAGTSGIVTKSCGRQIVEIDGRPAAEVYNQWVGGSLSEKVQAGGNILVDTTMHPLGVDAGKIEGITHYLLVHPEKILDNGVLSTFADIEEGTRLYSMRGERARLVDRAGKVASAAAATLSGGLSNLAGGLVVYCAGCMLAVGDSMPKVSQAVTSSFGGMPFLGCFTFGEQGAILNRNAHGNLMISAIAFGK